MAICWLRVVRIEREDNRTLIYGRSQDYHLVGTHVCRVEVGQFVPYEPAGVNFGWFIETPQEVSECDG